MTIETKITKKRAKELQRLLLQAVLDDDATAVGAHLAEGADPLATHRSRTPLCYATSFGWDRPLASAGVLNALLHGGSAREPLQGCFERVVIAATDAEQVSVFLPFVDLNGAGMQSARWAAMKNDNLPIASFKKLVATREAAMERDGRGLTALARSIRHPERVRHLLALGAPVDGRSSGDTALHLTAQATGVRRILLIQTIDALVEAGADLLCGDGSDRAFDSKGYPWGTAGDYVRALALQARIGAAAPAPKTAQRRARL